MKRRIISTLLIALTLIANITSTAFASTERASLYLSSYVAYLYDEGDGNISMWFEVEGTGDMDEIGVLSVRMQERAPGESTWTTVETYSHTDDSSLLSYNDNYHYGSVYYSGNKGYSYRASVTIWAGKDGDGDSRQILTDVITAR